MLEQTQTVVSITNDGVGPSFFSTQNIILSGDNNRMLSERINALNFRLRTSDKGYASSFHVAGDPTLLVVLSGSLQIDLHDGESRQFSAGDMFIAEDYLKPGIEFDESVHGHSAAVVGDKHISVLHIKLASRN